MTCRRFSLCSIRSKRFFCTIEKVDPFSKPGVIQALLASEKDVKELDPESHLCYQYLSGPVGLRGATIAVRAFNLELAKLVDFEATANAKLIRFEWWRDTLKAMAYEGEVEQNNPILRLLACAARSFRWEPRRLLYFVDARDKISQMQGVWTYNDIENYSELLYSNVFYLQLSCWPGELTSDQMLAASHMGAALGLTNYLRNVPLGIEDGRINIPGQLVLDYGLDSVPETNAFLKGQCTDKCRKLVENWADRIEAHFEMSWKYKDSLTREQRTVLLASLPARNYIQRLKKYNYDVFHTHIYVKPGTDQRLTRNLHVYRAAGWY